MHLNHISPQQLETILEFTPEVYLLASAIAAAHAVPLPGAAVDDIENYAQGITSGLNEIIGIFNEVRYIDVVYAKEVALQVWKCRYDIVFGSLRSKADRITTCGIDTVFGYGFYMSPDNAKKITENAEKIGKLLKITFVAAASIVENQGDN